MINGKLKDLKDVVRVFDKFKVPVFLSYGALLGAVRDKDFIKYDDDIDLCVTAKIDYKTRKDIGWKLYDLGFKTQNILFNIFGRMEPSEIGYNGDEKSGIIVCERNFKFSVFFFVEEMCPKHGREMMCYPKMGSRILISSPAKFYDRGEKIKFHGDYYLAPSPIKEYLEYTYGNWKEPVQGKHADQYFESHRDNPEMINIEGKNEVVIFK